MELSNNQIAPQLEPSYLYKTKPYNHQIAGFNYCVDKPFFALFAEQGTGKTKMTVDIMNAKYMRGEINGVLLIAPNGIHSQWIKEQLPVHSALPYTAAVYKSTASKGRKNALAQWLTTSYMELKWLAMNVEAFSYDSALSTALTFLLRHKVWIIVDEATDIKTPSANRTINILSHLGKTEYRGKRLISYTPYSVGRCILTGTPVTNSVYDLWTMFYFLKPNFFGRNYYAFKAHFGIEAKMTILIRSKSLDPSAEPKEQEVTRPLHKNEIALIHEKLSSGTPFLEVAKDYGMKPEDVLYLQSHPECDVPYKNLAELKASIAPYTFIVKKKDCYDLPDKTYKKVLIELTDEQKRLYTELKEEYITKFYDSEVSIRQKIALYIRLSQIVGGFLPYEDEATGAIELRPTDKTNPKVEAVLHELNEATYPLLITTRFRAEARNLYQQIQKHKPELVSALLLGDVIGKDKIREDYKQGKIDILIANEKMVARGYNLQNGDTIITYSQGYSAMIRSQREDRIHRDGQKSNKCLYIDIIGSGTIDLDIYAVIKQGHNLLEYMTNKNVKEFLTSHSEDVKLEFGGQEDE